MSEYKEDYFEEKERIKRSMPGARLYHVGSTAVDGLEGSGIIDILLFYDSSQESNIVPAMMKLGYAREGDLPYFTGKNGIHVHAFHKGASVNHMNFTNLLRNCDDTAARYEEFISDIREKFADDPVNYYNAKNEFISKVMED